MNSYALGSQILVTGTFTTAATGAAVDPTDVYFQFKPPTGVVTEYHYGVDPEVVKVSTGVYTVALDGNDAGQWAYRWYSTGTGQAAVEGAFEIKKSEFD